MTSWSLALRDIPRPHYSHTVIVLLDEHPSTDSAEWAERLFDMRRAPRWVAAAIALRQALVPVLGIPRSPRTTFDARETIGDETLIAADERHLDFRCGVAVDAESRLLRITTTVRLHGWRGRLYFAPVRVAHPTVIAALVRRAIRAQRAHSGRLFHA